MLPTSASGISSGNMLAVTPCTKNSTLTDANEKASVSKPKSSE